MEPNLDDQFILTREEFYSIIKAVINHSAKVATEEMALSDALDCVAPLVHRILKDKYAVDYCTHSLINISFKYIP